MADYRLHLSVCFLPNDAIAVLVQIQWTGTNGAGNNIAMNRGLRFAICFGALASGCAPIMKCRDIVDEGRYIQVCEHLACWDGAGKKIDCPEWFR